MSCTCLESLEKRELTCNYADALVNHFLTDMGEQCYEMLEFGIEQAVIRLVHTLAAIKHHEREIDDERVYNEVSAMLHEYRRKSTALINLLVEERKMVENQNVRH